MTRSPWLAPLGIVLVLLVFFTGCASVGPSSDDGVRAEVRADGGAEKAHGGHDARVALIVIASVFLVFVVVADVIILPCTIPVHRPFCCTREVITVVYR